MRTASASRPTTAASGRRSRASGAGADAAAVRRHVEATLGDPGEWPAPPSQTGVAMAAIAAVWGINARWESVRNVLARYSLARREAGGDPDVDGPEQLIALIDSGGGPEDFAARVGNRQRTSTRNGILKADAVGRVAVALRDAGIATPDDVRDASPGRLASLRGAWTEIPGQRSGLSFDAFLLATGRGTVKADRMVRRFVADALGRAGEQAVPAARAAALVERVAAVAGVDAPRLDAAIWAYESARARRR